MPTITTPSSPLYLKSFPNAAEALSLIDSLYIAFKKQFQRNINADLNLSTVSRASSVKTPTSNQYGQILTPPKIKNNFGGAMCYKTPVQDTYEIVVRWDMNDIKANKDVEWLGKYIQTVKS